MSEDYIIIKTSGFDGYLECDEIESLEQEVKQKIAEGYEPIGGVAVRQGQQSFSLKNMVGNGIVNI